MFQKSAVAAILMVVAAPAAAQVTGGSLDIEYDFPTDGGDLGGTTYSGAIEYSMNRAKVRPVCSEVIRIGEGPYGFH